MKSMHNRWICFLLAAVLLITYIPAGSLSVRADDFPNTYVNTGNQRQDLLGVAKTQVGYREGSGGYTKYGNWYGHSYMAWCGAFISWCANQAGIPTSVLKKNGFASARDFGLTDTFTIDNRLPQGGDLFFKNNGNHTGIVYYIEGDYFWTLEGNTWEGGGTDGVYSRKRSLYGEYYFASPKYQSDSSSTQHTYIKGTETAHPHKEYYKCSDCGDLYYTGGKATISGCKECQQENCSHSYTDYKKVDDTSHTAVCSKCDKKSTLNHTWKDNEILEEVSCENPGIKTQKCQQCGAAREVTVPQTNQHQYSDWERLDEGKHVRTCKVCGRQQEEAHKKSTWQAGVFEHWYECEVCGDRGGNEVHTFSGDCESACTTCKYVSVLGHRYGYQWMHDVTYHWQECDACHKVSGKAEHQFDSDCDSLCDTCGYVRQVTHEYADTLESNETGHWRRCIQCEQAEPAMAHKLGATATEETGQFCIDCGFEAVPPVAHIHDYTYSSDSQGHWGICQCGEMAEKEEHLWDVGSKTCMICGSPLPEVKDDRYLWYIALGSAGMVLLLILMAVIASAVKRKMMRSAARAAFRAMDAEGQEAMEASEEKEPQTV